MDRGEIERFYNAGGFLFFEELLQLVNRQVVTPFFRRRLRGGKRILDAGSGDGSLAGALGLSGAVYVDLARHQVRRCRERIRAGAFVQADLVRLPFKAGSFDQVICSNVLHYAGIAGMEEILRVTREGGSMVVSFLEDSPLTRLCIHCGISWGLLPPLLAAARLIELSAFLKMGFRVEESATVAFFPPLFEARGELPRVGFVVYSLEKRIRS